MWGNEVYSMGKDLTNRYSFSEVYDAFFSRCEDARKRKPGNWCCVAIDLDHFKLFNEVYGKERGDQLLARITAILQEAETACGGVSAYLGRDDFALFTQYDRPTIEALFRRTKDAVSELEDTVGFLPAFGIYRLDENDSVHLLMYDKAVKALLEAKQQRIRRICEYDPALYEKEKKEYEILLNLRKAMEQGDVTFYLQPQCRISTQKIVGAEALVRWIAKDGTLIPPNVFIPVLEKNGFIGDFDKLIWDQVCRWLRSLLDRGIHPVPISINVSQVDILTIDVADYLTTLCQTYDLPTQLLKVEITESAYAEEPDRVEALVKELKAKGFVTLMDDFGSGYSSLNMLQTVSVDVLKLDMVFLRERNIRSPRGVTILESIVNMAKMMGLPIVVEGAETEAQVQFLKDLGCRYAQGYYFYKPMPTAEFEALLQNCDCLDLRGFHCKRNEEFHVREFLDENMFSDTILNNVLGAVAFYALDGKDLSITRFNARFYRAIGDSSMESRQQAIQNYVVREDWPSLYRALEDAFVNAANGGTCEIRFYKSDGCIFWFRMHFFYLRNEGDRRIYYGQVEDVTEARQQSIQFFDVLREKASVTMKLNLDQKTIQYVTGGNTLYQVGLPSINLDLSVQQTAVSRIEDAKDRQAFIDFFDINRLKAAYRKAVYHECLTVGFRMINEVEPVEFSTYYIRYSKDQDLIVYAFAKRLKGP